MGIVVEHILFFCGSLILGWYLVPVMILAAKKLGMLDVPDGKIKVHKTPVPYLGGVAVYSTFIFIVALLYPLGSLSLWLLLGSTVLLLVGLIDDFSVLTPLQKLLGQMIAVVCFLKGGFTIKTGFFNTYINIVVSGFWMLSVINAFNLVDIMDGLATSLAIVSVSTFFVLALILQQYTLSLLLIAMLGALCAFLFYNRPSARIYLGDAGSLFIGGFVAAMPLLFHWTEILNNYHAYPSFAQGSVFWETAISSMVPILFVGLPLLEVISLIVIRRAKGIPFYSGSPHHFAIYLKNKGLKVWQILLFVGVTGCYLSTIGMLFMFGKISFIGLVIGLLMFSIAWFKMIFF